MIRFRSSVLIVLIFALCPTVRTLVGEIAGCERFDQANIPSWENAISNVERFYWLSDVVDDGDIEALIRPMRNLEAFHFRGSWMSFADELPNLQSWVDAITDSCCKTLESLTLNLEERAEVKTFEGLKVRTKQHPRPSQQNLIISAVLETT